VRDDYLHNVELDFHTPIARLSIDGRDFSKAYKATFVVEAGEVPVLTIEIPVDDAHIIGRCAVNKKFPDRVAGVPPYGYDADANSGHSEPDSPQ